MLREERRSAMEATSTCPCVISKQHRFGARLSRGAASPSKTLLSACDALLLLRKIMALILHDPRSCRSRTRRCLTPLLGRFRALAA